jgi:hypothetical protein
MKKLIAVGILVGSLAVSAMPALAQSATNCTQDMFGLHCTTMPTWGGMPGIGGMPGTSGIPNPLSPTHRTDCRQDMLGIHCITY